MRCFELLIGLLVLTVLGSFVALLVRVSPTWKDVFHGYVPSSGIVRGGGIYIAVGYVSTSPSPSFRNDADNLFCSIIGATVMPHAFFIGSKVRFASSIVPFLLFPSNPPLSIPTDAFLPQMATMRRLKPSEYGESDETAADRDVDDFEPDGKTTSANNAAQACNSFTDSERGRASQRLPPTRTYFPSLHLPQPLSMNGIVGNLATVSRARSRSNSPAPARYPPPPVIEEITVADVAAEGEEDDEGKKRPMDDVASVKPLKQSTRGAGERSKRSRPMPSLACINAHLGHAVWDIAGSLLGFAVVVNSSILILGAAVFYYGPYRTTNPDGVSECVDCLSFSSSSKRRLTIPPSPSLFDAYALVKDYLGQSFAYLFAVALLAAGQSASLTVTLSGQIVSEGCVFFPLYSFPLTRPFPSFSFPTDHSHHPYSTAASSTGAPSPGSVGSSPERSTSFPRSSSLPPLGGTESTRSLLRVRSRCQSFLLSSCFRTSSFLLLPQHISIIKSTDSSSKKPN